jgi:CheY-like chemotaxis protein
VLVVEDEVLVRFALAEFLRDCGFRVLEAADADEAIALLRHDLAVQVVLTDVEMPGRLNGFGLARWIREQRPAIRVVITSGHAQAAREASELCAEADYVAKPYDPTHLLAVIRRLLADGQG